MLIFANNSGGLYNFRNEFILSLVEKGNKVVLCTPFDSRVKDLKSLGVDLIEVPVNRRGINPRTDFKLLITYFQILKRENPDLVIAYTIKPNIYGGFACRMQRIPYVLNITGLGSAFERGGFLRRFVVFLYRISAKKAHTVFFENAENRDVFIEKKIVRASQAFLLNGAGVNLKYYKVLDYPEGDKIIFLFMGRIMMEKGVNELFSVMRKLILEGENIELYVLGECEENYKEWLEQYESEGWLHYFGFQTDVRPYIEKAHCFVLPSWHEGMANTNLECSACARPIITSDIPGCREAVKDGVTGFLTKARDEENLYINIRKFIQLSNDERKKMGLMARKRMEEKFDKEAVIRETLTRIGNMENK